LFELSFIFYYLYPYKELNLLLIFLINTTINSNYTPKNAPKQVYTILLDSEDIITTSLHNLFY